MITLYLATHKVTGMKYFGKSEVYHNQEDLQKYYHGKGFIFPEEAKIRVSNSLKGKFMGDLNPFFGKIHTQATRDKISLSRGNKTDGNKHWLYGKSHKEDTKQKMSTNHADFNGIKNPMFGMVSVRDLKTGENKRVSKEFFYTNKFNSKTKEGYLVGNASKIKNFKEV